MLLYVHEVLPKITNHVFRKLALIFARLRGHVIISTLITYLFVFPTNFYQKKHALYLLPVMVTLEEEKNPQRATHVAIWPAHKPNTDTNIRYMI